MGLAVFGGLVLVVLTVGGTASSRPQKPKSPAEQAFDRASAQIVMNAGDSAGFGNTPEARQLAARFSDTVQKLEKMCFTGGSEGGPSLTGGRFLVYCQINEGSVCFLVHVPQLRNYGEGKVRGALAKLGWLAAQTVTAELRKDRPRDLAVGMRGALAYGVIVTGKGDGDPNIVQGSIIDAALLHRYFAPAAPQDCAPGPGPVPDNATEADGASVQGEALDR
jgi:hypothetical protein